MITIMKKKKLKFKRLQWIQTTHQKKKKNKTQNFTLISTLIRKQKHQTLVLHSNNKKYLFFVTLKVHTIRKQAIHAQHKIT